VTDTVAVQASDRQYRGRLAHRAVTGVSLCWLVFVLLQHLLSGHWWLWLFPDTVPPLAFVLVPLLPVLAAGLLRVVRRTIPRRMGWLTAGAAVLALVLGFPQSGVNPAALLPRAEAALPEHAVHIFSWNTQWWDQVGNQRDHFFAMLRDQHADVYLLQEYMHYDESKGEDGALQVDDLPRLRQEFPGYQIVSQGELITLSRLPIVATPGPRTTDWATAFRDKVLRTDVRTATGVLSAYNVHIPVHIDVDLSPLSGKFYDFVRRTDAERKRQFTELISEVRANPNPKFIAGDFNTSPAMGDLDGLRAITTDAAPVSDALYPTTWQQGGIMPFWRLDWVFSSSNVRIDRYDFLDAQGLSDHRPQQVWLSSR